MEKVSEHSYFATAPLGRLIAKFAIPSIISLVVNSLYNIVDQIFIGQGVGILGNGATSIVFPLTVVATALALLIGDGGAAFLSLKLGAGEKEKAEKGVGNSITILVILGIVLLVIALIFLKPLLLLFGATDAILPYALEYGKIIAIGFPFVIISTGLNSIIRADGNPKVVMISMLVGAVINTVLDPVFIFVGHWGVTGAAWATIIGQFVSFVVSVIYIGRLKSVKLTKKSFLLKGKIIFSCCALGISSFITQVTIVIASTLCNILLAKYGGLSKYGPDIPITVMGIVMKVNQILISIVVGIAAGAQPILGYNFGAGNIKRVKNIYKIIVISALAVSAVACVAFQCFPQAIISLFGSGDDLYNEFAQKAFRIFLMMCIPAAFQIVSCIFMQAIGKPLPSMIAALLRQLIVFVPVAIILSAAIGVDGVLWTGPIADISSTIITLGMVIFIIKKLKEREKLHE